MLVCVIGYKCDHLVDGQGKVSSKLDTFETLPPSIPPLNIPLFFSFFKICPLLISLSDWNESTYVWSNLWWKLMYMKVPSLDHIPRQSPSKPITPTTVNHLFIFLPFLSLSVSCLWKFYPPLYFLYFHPSFNCFLNFLNLEKNLKIFAQRSCSFNNERNITANML